MTLVVDIHEAHVKGGIVGAYKSFPSQKAPETLHICTKGLVHGHALIGNPCQLGRKGQMA